MDQYVYVSGLTGDLEMGNGKYVWDNNSTYNHQSGCGCLIRWGIVVAIDATWHLFVNIEATLIGPHEIISGTPSVETPSVYGTYSDGINTAIVSAQG